VHRPKALTDSRPKSTPKHGWHRRSGAPASEDINNSRNGKAKRLIMPSASDLHGHFNTGFRYSITGGDSGASSTPPKAKTLTFQTRENRLFSGVCKIKQPGGGQITGCNSIVKYFKV
jgi:hypothetical protein